ALVPVQRGHRRLTPRWPHLWQNVNDSDVCRHGLGVACLALSADGFRERMFVPENERGVSYSRPNSGTDMPFKERFQARPCGRAFNAVLEVKLSVSSWTAAEATRNVFDYRLVVVRDWFLS